MFNKTLLACALVCALPGVARAQDFHPLESQELAGGSYSFDNFIIPEGVIVTLVGEPKIFDLVVNDTIQIFGELRFDDAWTLSLQSLNGSITMDGSITVDGEVRIPHGGELTVRSWTAPPRDIRPAVPEPSTWLMLLAGLGLVYLVAARELHSRDRQRGLRTPTVLARQDNTNQQGG